jgi:hypothetical protein
MPPGEALTSHFPRLQGVDFGCVSVLRHCRSSDISELTWRCRGRPEIAGVQ